ncbi:MAG: hypothetical protein K5694_01555 [Bacilli bacterium]|nr:hypothetical protein [Bacilli bacterium]
MIILIGASASGKTEIAKKLKEKYEMKKVVTHTSRQKRDGEVYDVDYHFVTVEEFKKLIEEDKLVEHTVYNGNYYGCSKAEIGPNKCLIVEPHGYKSFLALNDPSIVSFLLLCDKNVREQRMISRGDDPVNIEKRLKGDDTDFSPENIEKTDYQIDSSTSSIEELTDKIHSLYLETLKKRGLPL